MARVPQDIPGAETTYPHGLGTRMFSGTRATNFSIYTTKVERAGLQILGTGAKFKRLPCQKNCRVNRALKQMSSAVFGMGRFSNAKIHAMNAKRMRMKFNWLPSNLKAIKMNCQA